MIRTGRFDQRLRQTPLLSEPEIASASQVIERMLAKKFFGPPFGRLFVGHRFRTVLAEFRDFSIFIRTRPRATLANESLLLVYRQQRFERTYRSHLAQTKAHRLIDRRQSRCDGWSCRGRCRFSLDWSLRARRRIFLGAIRIDDRRTFGRPSPEVLWFLCDRVQLLVLRIAIFTRIRHNKEQLNRIARWRRCWRRRTRCRCRSWNRNGN